MCPSFFIFVFTESREDKTLINHIFKQIIVHSEYFIKHYSQLYLFLCSLKFNDGGHTLKATKANSSVESAINMIYEIADSCGGLDGREIYK